MQRKDPLHTSQNTTLSEQFKTMIKSDRNRGSTDTPNKHRNTWQLTNTQIHASSLSWLSTGNSIIGLKLVLWVKITLCLIQWKKYTHQIHTSSFHYNVTIFRCMCMFCRPLFALLSFFLWPLCCLSFDLRILITTLVSSSSSYMNMWMSAICLVDWFFVVWRRHTANMIKFNYVKKYYAEMRSE